MYRTKTKAGPQEEMIPRSQLQPKTTYTQMVRAGYFLKCKIILIDCPGLFHQIFQKLFPEHFSDHFNEVWLEV